MVHCQGRIATDVLLVVVILAIRWIPFADTSASEGYSAISIGFSRAWSADHSPMGGYINVNSTKVTLKTFDSSDPRDGFNTSLVPSDLVNSANSNDIIFSLTYIRFIG